jgi:hypothetical protein
MHVVQAAVLKDILTFLQDKTGREAQIVEFNDEWAASVEVTIRLLIPRDYPAMKEEEAEKS